MSQTLEIEVSDEVYAAIQRQAEAVGISAIHLIAASLEQQFGAVTPGRSEADKQAARRRFESHLGEVDLGYPTGMDNEGIDADLGREYADTHEEG